VEVHERGRGGAGREACTNLMHFVLDSGASLSYPCAVEEEVAKKLHVEITSANWGRMKDYIAAYNENAARVTPRYKPADVINLALHQLLKARKR